MISIVIIVSQRPSSPNPPCKSIMCPPASHECVGVNDSWIIQIILWLHWPGEDCDGSFSSHSCLFCLISLLPQHLIMIVPVSSGSIQHAVSVNDMFHNPVSSFCWSFYIYFEIVFKVSVVLEWISASYQQDSLMPTSLLCLPGLITIWTRGAFWLHHMKNPENVILCETKAELKLNSTEEPGKVHSGIRSCHIRASTLG